MTLVIPANAGIQGFVIDSCIRRNDRKRYTYTMNQVLLIDKPAGWTSFDVVAKIRGAARIISGNKKIKVGHAGTLDPFATGLLIVLIGDETKKQDDYMKQDKEYVATLFLGATSTTGDPEGIISFCHPERGEGSRDSSAVPQNNNVPSQKAIVTVLGALQGTISQTPPIYSAIKVDGKRAYKLAREGKMPEMKPREVTIHEIEVLNYDFPELKIRVSCSSGTYIRTLAQDIGKALGCGAYLTALRRTQIGIFKVEDALTVEEALKRLAN
jgi:tRNA pseudouridine55 synthase